MSRSIDRRSMTSAPRERRLKRLLRALGDLRPGTVLVCRDAGFGPGQPEELTLTLLEDPNGRAQGDGGLFYGRLEGLGAPRLGWREVDRTLGGERQGSRWERADEPFWFTWRRGTGPDNTPGWWSIDGRFFIWINARPRHKPVLYAAAEIEHGRFKEPWLGDGFDLGEAKVACLKRSGSEMTKKALLELGLVERRRGTVAVIGRTVIDTGRWVPTVIGVRTAREQGL